MLPWIAVIAFVAAALLVDLRVAGRRTPSVRSAAAWSVAWIVIGVAFAGVLLVLDGGQAASEYLAGFAVEKSLSLDNLFVFAVLFGFFAVPADERRRVLVYGIAGAIALRALFIVVGVTALEAFHPTTYVLGALLGLTAWKIARGGTGDHIDPEKTLAMRALRRVFPRGLTPVRAAMVMVAAFDVMFAIDSIPAVLAITRDGFLVFAANAFSLLGMVSLFFVLDGLLGRFRFLHLGLAAILAYVAAKLLLVDVWHPPTGLSLAVVLGLMGAAALASVVAERRDAGRAQPS
ncbi:MAG TPA: TerC/Alx family metal homeostasis membrane protein [Solirubrobacteraceae bacterium]|nr:TerC/Alx family metal homeostasis membrane protein [Solirubrobacteraceae bacterium]